MSIVQQGARRPSSGRSRPASRLVAAAVGGALAVVLSACSPASDGPTPTPSDPVVASPTPSPTPSPTEEPSPTPDPTPTQSDDRSELLIQPKEMEHDDEAGAIAAAKYYMGLYEYVYLTGDLEMWEAMALPDCEFCKVVSEGVTEMHGAGRYRVSGPPTWIGKPKTDYIQFTNTWDVTMRAEVSASTTYDTDDQVVEENKSGVGMVTLGMVHDGETWRTIGIVVETDE